MEINKKIELELLAPAKDLKTGKMAVLAGADAVYIGGPAFGARAAVVISIPVNPRAAAAAKVGSLANELR